MNQYAYIAIDPAGGRVSGEIDATDPDAVVSQLTARGLRVETVRLILGTAESSPAPAPRQAALSAADTRELGSHISEIVMAGLPLEAGLAAIAQEFPRGRLRRSLRAIVIDLEAGNDLETVLKRHRTAGYLPALVRAGQRSGRTGEILENFIAATQVAAELRQTLAMAFAYPVILILTLFALLLFLQMEVIPQFGEIFDDFGMKLPVPTRALLVTSEFLNAHGGRTLLIVAAAVVLLIIACRIALGELGARRVVCRLPIVGSLLRWSALARFSPLLSVLIEARVPLDQALPLAGEVSGDAEIRDDCRKLASSLQAGSSLEEAAIKTARFPASFVRALTWERYHEAFPEVLRSMADMYAGRVRALVMLLAVLLPPLVFVCVVGVVGGVVVVLYLPLFNLLKMLAV